jgi:hypothetical protein
MATFPTMTLNDLRTEIYQRADQLIDAFVSISEMNAYINESAAALYDLLIQKYGNNYFVKYPAYSFTTDGSTDRYPLPSDFYKLLGVDLQISGAGVSNGKLTLRPFNMADRNRFVYPNVQVTFGIMSNLRYKLHGNNLWLVPMPAANQVLFLEYIPKLTKLQDTITITLKANLTDGDFVKINAISYTATSNGFPPQGQFHIGVDAPTTAANLCNALNNDNTLAAYMSFSVVGSIITGTLNGGTISVFTTNYPVRLGLSPSLGAGLLTDTLDTISGWGEYIVVDSARKCLIKEETDPSALIEELERVEKRIENAAENRDAGFPKTVSDSRRRVNGDYNWEEPY